MSNTTSNHPSNNYPSEQHAESLPSLSYSEIPSLKILALLQLHLSLFMGILRPTNALDPVHFDFEIADLIRSSLPGIPPMVMLNTAQAVEAVFSAPPYSFVTASDVGVPLLGPETLFAIDGVKHQQHRKLIMPPFHGKSLQAYGQIMVETTQNVTSTWQLDKVFPIHPTLQDITLQVILRVLLGFSEEKRYSQLQLLFRDMLNAPLLAACLFFKPLQIDLGGWSPWGKLICLKRQIDQLLMEEIGERRNQDLQNDVLGLFLSARDEQGQILNDLEIRNELMAVLFAANEATAAALTWAIYWVHCDTRVRDEILAELTDLGPNPDCMEIAKLPYLSAVCNEVLRISPVTLFAVPRSPKQLFNLLDYNIEPGTLLSPCIYLVHRDPDVYSDPQSFRPERFLEHQYSPYEFMPFGGSNRRCVGYALALFELKVVLAEMLSKINFSLANQNSALPERHGTTFIPSGGLRVIAKLRKS